MASFDLSDYVDVSERERQLFERYPDARIQVDLVEVRNGADELTGWAAKATIWRSPEDTLPVCDWAVEPVPGKTPYTKDSEAMNASTSAVGRAIVLAGFPTKKIASADEVRARQSAGELSRDTRAREPGPAAAPTASPAESPVAKAQAAAEKAKAERTPTDDGESASVVLSFGKHKGKTLSEVGDGYLEWLTKNFEPRTPEQRRIIAAANVLLGNAQAVFGQDFYTDDIPF